MTRRGPGRVLAGGLLVVASFLVPGPIAAQVPPGGGTVRVKLSQRAVAFPTPGAADFDAGWVDAPAVVVTVRPRKNQGAWELRIRTDDPDLGGPGKPVTDLMWRPAEASTWTPLTGTDQMVTQGTGPRDVTLYFRLRVDYASDPPAVYSGELVFHAETL